MLYRLVLAGCNCHNAHIKTYDYDISIIVQKESIDVLDYVAYDTGDIRLIKDYLPDGLEFFPNDNDDPFYGNIKELNW